MIVQNGHARLVTDAIRLGGIDVSLSEVIHAFNLPFEDILGSSLRVIKLLDEFNLYLDPDHMSGDINTRRLLAYKSNSPVIDIKELLDKSEESRILELKGSMVCDLKRLEIKGEAHKNDSVIHSFLKTICGFANADGGVLLIGVLDDKTIIGIKNDYLCGIENQDKWQLEFYSYLKGRVFNGAAFEPYVKVSIILVDEIEVAYIQVFSRNELTFIKSEDGKRYEYYLRTGNKTEQITLELFSEHLLHRNSYKNSHVT